MRSEEDEVAEGPPAIDPVLCTVIQHRAKCAGNAVDVGDDPKSHGATVQTAGVPNRREGIAPDSDEQ